MMNRCGWTCAKNTMGWGTWVVGMCADIYERDLQLMRSRLRLSCASGPAIGRSRGTVLWLNVTRKESIGRAHW